MRLNPERLRRRFQVNGLAGLTGLTGLAGLAGLAGPGDKPQFQSLDVVSTYLNIRPIVEFIQSLEDQSLKNIWNAISVRWTRVHISLSDNSAFQGSAYKDQTYGQVHTTFNHPRFSELVDDFIQKDIMKALFVSQCIMDYVYPK